LLESLGDAAHRTDRLYAKCRNCFRVLARSEMVDD